MAEITVSGGVFATLTPIFTLWYGHKENHLRHRALCHQHQLQRQY